MTDKKHHEDDISPQQRLVVFLKLLRPAAVLIILLEIGVRFADLPPWPFSTNIGMQIPSNVYSYTPTPNYMGTRTKLQSKYKIVIDELGLRNNHTGEVIFDESKTKVLFIGDSMTYGDGVNYDKSFPALVSNDKYQTFNAGVLGYSSINTLLRLRDVGPVIKPEIVVYSLYIGNDINDSFFGIHQVSIEDMRSKVKEIVERDESDSSITISAGGVVVTPEEETDVEMHKESSEIELKFSSEEYAQQFVTEILDFIEKSALAFEKPSTVKRKPPNEETKASSYPYSELRTMGFLDAFLVNTSELYRFLRYKMFFIPKYRKIYIEKGVSQFVCSPAVYTLQVLYDRDVDTEEWVLTLNLLLEMKRYVEKDLGADFVLVLIPERGQINKDIYRYQENHHCFNNVEVDHENPNRILKEFSEVNDILLIDTTNNLREEYLKGDAPFFSSDEHLNGHGHYVVSEIVKDVL
ncbi:SGNH/GDSL hydrolase family protein [Patescibacteria group bacterium]